MQGLFMFFSDNVKSYSFTFTEDPVNQNGMRKGQMNGQDYLCAWNILDKFAHDKVMHESEKLVICIDGVILNLKRVLEEEKIVSFQELIEYHYFHDSLYLLLKKLRGSFCGVVYNKISKRIIAFTDQLSTRPLFYKRTDNNMIFSTEVVTVTDFCKENNIKYTLDEIGAYSLISYGYMLGDHTLIENLKRIPSGTIISVCDNKFESQNYYCMNNLELNISEDQAVEQIDSLFERAVKLQLEKNKEYGYFDYAPMSAGMDCRMTSFMINRITKRPITNFTYSEFGEYDCYESGKMSNALSNRWLFKNLDNGLDLFDIDKAIQLSDGLIYYFWPAQLNDFMREFDTNKWGIVHTGVLGDVIIGSFKKDNRYCRQYRIGDGAFSTKLIGKIKGKIDNVSESTEDYEIGMFKNRGFNGACLGYTTTFRHYAENLSPFMNIDFFDFCLSLPLKYRYNDHIYYNWVKKKFPLAAEFKHNGVTIKGNSKIKFRGRYYRLRAIPDLTRNKILQRYKKGYGMNPMQLWLDNNIELRTFMNDYYDKNMFKMTSWQELMDDAKKLYDTGTAQEKIMVLSLIGSIKMLF